MVRQLGCTFLLLAAASCERSRPPDPAAMIQRVMGGMLVYPKSTRVSVSAGEDAAQLTLTTPDSIGPVADWFRKVLSLNGWKLQSDLTERDGSVTISAVRGTHPLWLTLKPNVGAPGTTYTLIGAEVSQDSVVKQDSGQRTTPAR